MIASTQEILGEILGTIQAHQGLVMQPTTTYMTPTTMEGAVTITNRTQRSTLIDITI